MTQLIFNHVYYKVYIAFFFPLLSFSQPEMNIPNICLQRQSTQTNDPYRVYLKSFKNKLRFFKCSNAKVHVHSS